jgi:hypothetical protein
VTESQVVNVLIVALIVIPIVSWATAIILIRLAIQKPYITSLTERAISGVLKAVGSTGVAFIALNTLQHWIDVPRPWGIGILAICLLILEIPAAVWLSLYYTSRFRGDA